MAGKIKKIIDSIINQRSSGNPVLASTTKTKLLIKGIDPDKYSDSSDDDPSVIAKLEALAAELNVKL